MGGGQRARRTLPRVKRYQPPVSKDVEGGKAGKKDAAATGTGAVSPSSQEQVRGLSGYRSLFLNTIHYAVVNTLRWNIIHYAVIQYTTLEYETLGCQTLFERCLLVVCHV